MFPWNKWPWTNYHELNLDWIVTRVRELYEWVNRTLKQFTEDLQQETSDRIEADQQLQANIDKEQAAREAADQQLQENINAEAAAREAADTQLQNNIDAEEAARQQADTQLQNNIDAEEAARQQADTQLQNNIDAEEAARQQADTQLQANITAEATARQEADQQLQANITAEQTAREQADQQLQNSIDTLRGDAILKDGSTTTTAAIPFAQGIKTGSIAETSPDAGVSIEAQLDLNSHKITSLADGTDNTDAVNVGQLEAFAADVHSIPAGGSSGQVLAKASATDYDVAWVEQSGGGGEVPPGGTTGQVLAKSSNTDYALEWVDPTAGPQGPQGPQGETGPQGPQGNPGVGVPTGGTAGQVLAKVDGTDYNTQWVDPTGKLVFVESINKNFGIYKDENRYYIVATKDIPATKATASALSGQSIFSNGKKYTSIIYNDTISTEYFSGATMAQLIEFRFVSDSQIGFLTSYRNGTSFTIESNWISSSEFGNGFAIYKGQIVFTGLANI